MKARFDAPQWRPRAERAISPAEFAERTRELLKLPDTVGRHRLFDELSNEVLSALGYRQGVELFVAGVRGWHDARS